MVLHVVDTVIYYPDSSFRAKMLVLTFLEAFVAEGSQLNPSLCLPSAEDSYLAQGHTAFVGRQYLMNEHCRDLKAGHPLSGQDQSEGHPRAHYRISCGFVFDHSVPCLPSSHSLPLPLLLTPEHFQTCLQVCISESVFRKPTLDSWRYISGLGRRVCLRDRNSGTSCHSNNVECEE